MVVEARLYWEIAAKNKTFETRRKGVTGGNS
jgi:hypothetical protein